MKSKNIKVEKRERRHKKIRSTIFGTLERPRLSVFRSNKYVYAQLINDEKGETLAALSSQKLATKKGGMLEKAREVGKDLAKIAKAKNIEKVVFDRGGFLYKGKIKAIAEGAREGGLVF